MTHARRPHPFPGTALAALLLAGSALLVMPAAQANTPVAPSINPPSKNITWLAAAQDADIE
ncbi:MAG: hypothetical protein ACKPCJ_11620, partial [Betaproteobacteria bacterium]